MKRVFAAGALGAALVLAFAPGAAPPVTSRAASAPVTRDTHANARLERLAGDYYDALTGSIRSARPGPAGARCPTA